MIKVWLQAIFIGVGGPPPFTEKISIPDFIKRRAKGELELGEDGQLYELRRPVEFQIRRKNKVILMLAASSWGSIQWVAPPDHAIYFKRESDFNIKTLPVDADYHHSEYWL